LNKGIDYQDPINEFMELVIHFHHTLMFLFVILSILIISFLIDTVILYKNTFEKRNFFINDTISLFTKNSENKI